MKTLIDFISISAILYLALWALCTMYYIVSVKKLKKRYTRRVSELDIEAKGLIMRLEEKERVIESLNNEVSRLNAKVKKDRLITTLEDLENERTLL